MSGNLTEKGTGSNILLGTEHNNYYVNFIYNFIV